MNSGRESGLYCPAFTVSGLGSIAPTSSSAFQSIFTAFSLSLSARSRRKARTRGELVALDALHDDVVVLAGGAVGAAGVPSCPTIASVKYSNVPESWPGAEQRDLLVGPPSRIWFHA